MKTKISYEISYFGCMSVLFTWCFMNGQHRDKLSSSIYDHIKRGPQNMSSSGAMLFLRKGLWENKCGIYTPADRSTQMIEKWNVVASVTFMSGSKVGHDSCKTSTFLGG